MYADEKPWIGRKLESVALSNGGEVVTFRFEDGAEWKLAAEGDCCSTSWIEHLEAPNDLRGATLLSVHDSENAGDEECRLEHDDCRTADVLAVYHTTFRTDRGDVVLEFRNDSNGYYGGYLVDVTWRAVRGEQK